MSGIELSAVEAAKVAAFGIFEEDADPDMPVAGLPGALGAANVASWGTEKDSELLTPESALFSDARAAILAALGGSE